MPICTVKQFLFSVNLKQVVNLSFHVIVAVDSIAALHPQLMSNLSFSIHFVFTRLVGGPPTSLYGLQYCDT